MRSPVSGKALGECNAITRRGFDPAELTFASALETEFIAHFGAPTIEPTAEVRRLWMVGYDKKRTKNIEPGRAEFFNRRRS